MNKHVAALKVEHKGAPLRTATRVYHILLTFLKDIVDGKTISKKRGKHNVIFKPQKIKLHAWVFKV